MSTIEGKDAPPIEVQSPSFESEETLIPFWSEDESVMAANTILMKELGRSDISKTTMHRWANDGYPLRDGTNVRVRLPGETRMVINPNTNKPVWMMVTTKEAVYRFLETVRERLGGPSKTKTLSIEKTQME